MNRRIVCLILLAPTFATGCRSPFWTDRAALIGGLLGAGAGAAVAKDHGNPAAGAILGAAMGSTAGAVVGSGIDQNLAAQAAVTADVGNPLLITDVTTLSAAGLSDAVIVNHIQSQGFAGQLTANDLITLKQQGVSDRVIEALQQPTLRESPSPQTVIVDQSPVVTVEPQVVIPAGPRRARRGGWSIGLGL